MEVFLHVGLAKTGTTAIQEWCDEHVDYLQGLGWVYPDSFRNDGAAHHQLAIMAAEGRFQEICDQLRKTCAKFDSQTRILFSSEALSTLKPHVFGALMDVLSSQFDRVNIVLTLRPHLSLFLGQYTQQLREGYIRAGLTSFWHDACQHANFLRLEESVKFYASHSANHQGKLIALVSERGLSPHEDIVSGLMWNLLGGEEKSDAWKCSKAASDNVSPGTGQLRLIHEFTNQYPSLWGDSLDWPCRRFVYLAFQHFSRCFVESAKLADHELLASQLLVASDFRHRFAEDWLSTQYFSSESICAETIDNWYEAKIEAIELKISQVESDVSANYARAAICSDSSVDSIVEESLKFFRCQSNITGLGASEQLAEFSKHLVSNS